MKRSPLKRGRPLKRKRDTPRRRAEDYVNDSAHRAFVASLPCAVCCALVDPRLPCPQACGEAHHAGTHGLGQKPSDLTCVPLCRTHHDDLHDGRLTPINQSVQAWEDRTIRCVVHLAEQWTSKRKTGFALSETARLLFFATWSGA